MPYSSDAMNGQTSEPGDSCPKITPALSRALAALESEDFYTRWEAAKQISACGVEAIEPLLALLQTEDLEEELSWYIARILGTFDHPLAVKGLTQLLQNSGSSDVAGMAATALANCGAAAISPLTHLMHQPETRLLAIRALAQIHHPDVVPLLLQLMSDPIAAVRSTAIDALSCFSDPAIANAFLAALHDPDSRVRRSAVSALGVQAQTFDSHDLLAALQPLLQDENLEVCCQTAITIGRVGTPGAIVQLGNVLHSTTAAQLQQAIVRSIGWIDTPEAVLCLQEALSDLILLSEETQLEIIAVLGRFKSAGSRQAAVQTLLSLLHMEHSISQSSKGKQTIAHSLGQLAPIARHANTEYGLLQTQASEIIAALVDLLEDADSIVQLHAIAALKAFDNGAVDLKLIALIQDEKISPNLREGISVALAERKRSIGNEPKNGCTEC